MKMFIKCSLATAILAASVTTAQAETELVVVSWGGAYTKSQQKAYSVPFMEANKGIKIINDDSSAEAASKLRAQAEAGKVTWDVVDVLPDIAIALCDEGLAVEINPEKDLAKGADGSSAKDDFGDALISPCFIPEIVYSTTIGYRTDKVGDTPPSTIADVFDLKKYPGKRALNKNPTGNLEWALIADGVAIKDVYKELATEAGVKRAFKKLDTIKKDVVWWTKGAQPGQLLADGEVVMASAYNGRLFSAIVENKQPVGMMWDAQLFELDGYIIPKGAPHMKEAMAYVKFATDTKRQADQAKYISYGPARKSSAALVGKHAELGIDMAPHMPTNPANAKNVLYKDINFWADHKDELAEKFEAWLAKG
ncbi:MAG: ABC transporter substrate-binding protein [Cocleimonas sp.]|nr:ABC transporter substrate-binding protein [Cocleimonas sp.]